MRRGALFALLGIYYSLYMSENAMRILFNISECTDRKIGDIYEISMLYFRMQSESV